MSGRCQKYEESVNASPACDDFKPTCLVKLGLPDINNGSWKRSRLQFRPEFIQMNRPPRSGRFAVAIVAALLSFAPASGQHAPSLKVMISPGFRAAYEELR